MCTFHICLGSFLRTGSRVLLLLFLEVPCFFVQASCGQTDSTVEIPLGPDEIKKWNDCTAIHLPERESESENILG